MEMPMNPMLPMVFLLSEKKDRQRDVADALLPAIVPGPPATRLALTAVVADTAVRRQETKSAQVAEEAISAATTPSLDAKRLERFERLKPVLARRPDLHNRLLAISEEQDKLGEVVVSLADQLQKGKPFDLDSDEARPLRDRLSPAHRTALTKALEG
jgi:hypothetical protein